ncbi:hypothetical protein AWE51_16080 [Aquimarina aggregata]|uniref:DoxX-like family protein n=1 Tax=Aquimarina aggregata TaxID=1642818 RepID=A0A163CZK4_9FLAO|nr:DoxX family protein [Aquimarina aggregata]KZS42885.1 hypothetical protein AWE51_16080 [Aquimarina aggregata]
MKTIYWTSTGLLSILLLWSSYSYIFSQATITGIRALGFPDHFRIQLAVLKIIAVIILLVPQIPLQIKEWAYAGVTFFFITSIVAHTAHKDSIFISLLNLLFIALVFISSLYLHKSNIL